MSDNGIRIREMVEAEHPCIYSYVINSALDQNKKFWDDWNRSTAGPLPPTAKILARGIHDQLEEVLINPHTATCACLSESPDTILGFAVAGADVLHYVFVKEQFRRHGIASALIANANLPTGMIVSTVTASWVNFALHCKINWTFDPFRARER